MLDENIPNETISREDFAQLARDTGNVVLTPQEIAAQEYAERVLCRRRLLPFVHRFNKQYQAGWVHKDVCMRLERFSDQVINRESPRLMLFMPPRSGKALADTTPILTANRGWTTHGELIVGDQVFSPTGKPVSVIGISMPLRMTHSVEFSDGSVIGCHAEHEWTVYNRGASRLCTVETSFFCGVTKHGKQRQLKSAGRYIYQLPLIAALEFPEATFDLHPYVLGAWLGDGSRSKPCITHSPTDTETISRIESYGYPVTARCVHSITGVVTTYFSGPRPNVSGRLWSELCANGLRGVKFIPEAYFTASVEQRLQLLAGLIDTDGTVDRKSRVTYSSVDTTLADGVYRLALELGFRPYRRVVPPQLSTSGVHGRKPVHVIGFQPTLPIPCAIPRKRILRTVVQRALAIVAVTEQTGGSGRCIQVDSPDGLYLAGLNLIPTHNSELASRNFPAWHLGRAPEHEFIVTSYSSSLAMKFSRSVRSLLREPAYDELFPGTKLDPDTQAVEFWQTTAGGAYMAAGVSGPLTGNGMHVGVIDDPVKNREEADSDTVRESIKEWYTSTFYTRLAPGAGILLILTRWHHDDLAGWLLEEAKNGGDQWEVVVYPAIAEHDEKYRRKGEALHPERYDLEALERIQRAVGPRDWQALYQQQPTAAEGAFFKKDWFRYYLPKEAPHLDEMTLYTAWDFAIGTKDGNDYTVGITVGVDRDHNIYVLDVTRGRWDALQICDTILDTWLAFPSQRVGMERGQISMALGPLLEKRIAERNLYGFPYDPDGLKTGKADKAMRATPIQGRTRQGKVYFPRHSTWLASFESELLSFPSGVHDDQVDAFAWIGQMMGLYAPPTAPKPKAPKWVDKLGQLHRLSRKTGGSTLMGA
ncbi:MAG: hypothetical protein E6R03_04145 [Hyphomicrobiaceae bacterium]|nr:MAG: hypothetical protein E6R03_04145 [Hyphomicrobiaceae bacterium]